MGEPTSEEDGLVTSRGERPGPKELRRASTIILPDIFWILRMRRTCEWHIFFMLVFQALLEVCLQPDLSRQWDRQRAVSFQTLESTRKTPRMEGRCRMYASSA